MRPIDADALIEEVQDWVDPFVLTFINNAPTVEPEKPQGEWVRNDFNEHHCNRCGHPALWEEEPDDYYEVQSRFCPNCGADMRGGAE